MFALALAFVTLAGTTHGVGRVAPDRVHVPAGSYRPLYATPGAARMRVSAFSIDREPVTRGDFELFLRDHPAWRRDAIRPVLAETGYLSDWPSATNAGSGRAAQPVTDVSWFAARAYCAASGGRLPTVDEWEYVAGASATEVDATRNPAFAAKLLSLYSRRAGSAIGRVGREEPNAFGVRDLHSLVWEWTEDFNSVIVSDDSRASGAGGDERDHHLFCASAAIGSTDPSNYAAFLRYAFRSGLTGRSTARALGFRCAATQ